MDRLETCAICHQEDSPSELGLWLAGTRRETVHVECWIATYRGERASVPASAA
jgi:hypothetical protein